VRFENKHFFFFEKTLQPTTTLALYLVVNPEVVGSAPSFGRRGKTLEENKNWKAGFLS
jgi:hypothetical protein